MKSSPILLCTLLGCLGLATMNVGASPRAAEASGAHYLFAAENLSGWHIGGFYRYNDREANHSEITPLKQNKYIMQVGRDLFDWLSIYCFLVATAVKMEPWGGDTDTSLEYGCGVWANLLDHDLLSNMALETRLRLQALAQVSAAHPEVNGSDNDYLETYGTITLSIVNELLGNKNYWPEAIGVFFGPVYNDINFDDDYVKLTGETFGVTIGLDIYFTRKTTLSLAYENFSDDKALNAALDFRF